LIRPPTASRSLLDHRGRHPQPRIALELAQEPGGRPSWRLVGNFLGQPKESFTKPFDPFGVYLKGKYPTHSVHTHYLLRHTGVVGDETLVEETLETDSERGDESVGVLVTFCDFHTMASRGRHGGASAREDEPRRDERVEQQAPAPQGSILPPPPPVDYGVFMQGLVQAMQTQAHTQAAVHAQLEAQEGEMKQYLEEKKASQKRPVTTFQRQDKKKAVYLTQQRPVAVSSTQVPSVRSPGVKKECPHCGRTHGGSECWMITDKCLKCGSSDHKIKDCPRLQHGVQRGALVLAAVAAAAPATGRPGRPRAPARVFALAREDAEQAEHVTEGVVGDETLVEETLETDSEHGD
ncbi:hypothetical protein Taro_014396, partial [Colocasia esculenta]|nr:hypothetical protein [Colocasia esculenta]